MYKAGNKCWELRFFWKKEFHIVAFSDLKLPKASESHSCFPRFLMSFLLLCLLRWYCMNAEPSDRKKGLRDATEERSLIM